MQQNEFSMLVGKRHIALIYCYPHRKHLTQEFLAIFYSFEKQNTLRIQIMDASLLYGGSIVDLAHCHERRIPLYVSDWRNSRKTMSTYFRSIVPNVSSCPRKPQIVP